MSNLNRLISKSALIKSLFSISLLIFILVACKSYVRVASVRNNVCKTLEKKTVFFAVFVDSDGTHPWTEFDINSTLDSIQESIDWLHKTAEQNSIDLSIELAYAKKGEVVPFKEELKYLTLSKTLFKYLDINKGIKLVDNWSNNLSKDVARSLTNDSSKIILTNNKMNDRERLIAKLRNKYKTDNIALVFFINNYFENEISVTLHSGSSTETEYAVVSTKDPAVIAHEFLHLFGALDLYITPFDHKLFENMKKRRAMKKYPDEIMAFAYRDIDSLHISPLTKYLIGWSDKLENGDGKFFLGHRWKFLEY